MNKYFLLFILSIFMSCGSVKKIYAPASAERIVILDEAHKQYLKKKQLFLCFTKTYNNDRIIVKENDSLRIDTLIKTGEKKIALALKVNNKSKITVWINNIKPFTIDPNEMAFYKFVYIDKKKKNVLIDFNNGSKKLD